MLFRTIEVFDWIKRVPSGFIDMTLCGIQGPETISELGLDEREMPLRGNNYYGYQPLKEIIAENYKVNPSRVAITPGASMGNFTVVASLAAAGDRVIVESPTYQPFLRVAEAVTGIAPTRIYRKPHDAYLLDRSAKELNTSFKLFQITNLHNPSGRFSGEKELIELADKAASQNGWIVADEVFLPFIEGGETKTAAGLHDRIISTCSLTKVWGMPGLRVGWVIGQPDLIRQIEHIMDYLHVVQSFLTDHIAYLILADKKINQRLLQSARSRSKTNLKIVLEYLSKIRQLDYVTPAGGISILLRFKDGRDSKPFTKHLRDNYNTLVMPGEYFEIRNGFRLSFGMDETMLRNGLDAVGHALDRDEF